MTPPVQPAKAMRPLLTPAQAAELLGISMRTLSRMKRDGLIAYVRLGRRLIRYRQEELEKLLKRAAQKEQ